MSFEETEKTDSALADYFRRLKVKSDFEFQKEIGDGSFSTVYKAKEKATGTIYAIKECYKSQILKEKKIKYVHLEKKILSDILSESQLFVKLYCTFQDQDNLYFVLTYCSNGDLLSYMRKSSAGKLSINRVRFYAAELVEALKFMHSKLVIHRDLKPENILVDENHHLKITDFGTARYLGELNDPKYEDQQGEQHRRRKNSFVGTAQFVSPEILQGKEPHFGTDLWSLGCVLYQMLTGKHLFTGNHEYDIFQKVVKAEYALSAESFDTQAKDLITRLVVKEPDERLGASQAQGYDKLMMHPFFSSIEWHSLLKQQVPSD